MAAKLPWYQWFHRDWLMDEARADMNLSERGLYRDCLDLNYANGSIPADPSVLFRLLAVDREEFDAAWVKVSEYFEPTEWDATRLTNSRANEVMGENKEYRKAQSDHAKKGWEKRRKQKTLMAKGTHKQPIAEGKGSQCYSDADADTESEKKNTPPTPQGGSGWRERFDDWWQAYPRKAAKGDALKAYKAIVFQGKVRDEQRAELVTLPDFTDRHARLVASTTAWLGEFKGRDPTTVPYPATFLRRLDWLAAPVMALAKRGMSDAERRQERSQDNIREWLERKRAEGGSDSNRVVEVCADIS